MSDLYVGFRCSDLRGLMEKITKNSKEWDLNKVLMKFLEERNLENIEIAENYQNMMNVGKTQLGK